MAGIDRDPRELGVLERGKERAVRDGRPIAGNEAVVVAKGGYEGGLSGVWYWWSFLFATPVYYLFATWFRRARVYNLAEFLAMRYGASVASLARAASRLRNRLPSVRARIDVDSAPARKTAGKGVRRTKKQVRTVRAVKSRAKK